MTVTVDTLDAMLAAYYGRDPVGQWADGRRDDMRKAVEAMRALEPKPTPSDDARVEHVLRLLKSQDKVADEDLAFMIVRDLNPPLRSLSGDGIEAAAKAAAPTLWVTYDEEMREDIRADMRRAIAAFLAAEGRSMIKWRRPEEWVPLTEDDAPRDILGLTENGFSEADSMWPGNKVSLHWIAWSEMPAPPPWAASPQPDHAEPLVAPDVWEPPEQCETPAVCLHQGMCEKFMVGKCTASVEPSERAVLGRWRGP